MLKRLYVDNYKCFSNSDLVPGQIQLLLGRNASGKSTVFEVLLLIQRFLAGGTTTDLFPGSSLTRWEDRKVQTFELEIQPAVGPASGGTFTYRLEVEHEAETRQNRVKAEVLTLDGKPLFQARLANVQLYRDDHSAGPTLTLDWHISGVGSVAPAPRGKNKKLTWFKEWVSNVRIIQPNPFSIISSTEREERQLALNLSNFPSWYRHLSLARPEAVEVVRKDLSQVIEGFFTLKLVPSGEGIYTLKATIRTADVSSSKAPMEYSLEELSHGQRILVTLYTLLHAGLDSPDALLCIDEPDNFVALAEIQPWLTKAVEMAQSSKSQLLLASHHPEILNQLARDHGLIFTRNNGGPTRIVKFEAGKDSALTPAEVIARGWEE